MVEDLYSKIAKSFVKQYYDVLARTPENLHKFFAPTASYSYASGLQPATIFTGAEIQKQLEELNFKGVLVDLSAGSFDVTPTADGSLITITGVMTHPSNKVASPFTETFLLGKVNGAVFLLNDMLRVGGSSKRTKSASSKAPKPASPKEAKKAPVPVVETPTKEEKAEVAATAAEIQVMDEIENGHMPEEELMEPEPKEKEPEAAPVVEEKAVEAAPVAAAAPAVDPVPEAPAAPAVPKSWASIAAKPSSTPVAPAAPTVPRVVKAAAKTAATAPAARKESPRPAVDIDLAKSLFVKDVTAEVTQAELEATLSKFGTVTSVEINHDRRYAFVTFEDPASVKKAAADGKVTCAGASLTCEERHSAPKTRGGRSRGGGRGRTAAGTGAGAGQQNGAPNNNGGRSRARGNKERGGKPTNQRG